MYLKRYRMSTVREALARAKAELGPDALVLSTRVVAKSGVSGWLGGREVEITAAALRPVSENRLLEQDGPSQSDRVARPRTEQNATAKLTAAGLDHELAQEVVASLPWSQRRGASVAALHRALAGCLTPLVIGEEAFAPVEVFVGPPGAGKTTTIAKIAAQERARRGRKLSLVAADAHRVGAVEQLRLYASVIGAPFAAARTALEAERALATMVGPVLVDTAGHSAKDRTTRELFELLAGRVGVRTHLVFPAGSPGRDVERLLSVYEPTRPDRIVLTRLDEAESLSPLVGVLRRTGIPISFLATGQRVPEDLERASAVRLAASVLGELAA